MRELIFHVRKVHCRRELLLEIRLNRQFDVFNFARDFICFGAFFGAEQRHTRAVTGSVPHRMYIL